MQHPDEGTIHAWLDGELSVEEGAALEAHAAECAQCAAAIAEARGLIAASSRIVSALDIVPGDVIPIARPRARAWYSSTQLRAAAAVIVVAGASLLVMRRSETPVALQSRTMASERETATATAPALNEPAVQPQTDQATALASPPAALPVQKKEEPKEKGEAEAPRRALQKTVSPPAETRTNAKSADELAAAAPMPSVVAKQGITDAVRQQGSIAKDSIRSRVIGADALSQVVITGVAVATESPLKEVRADTTGNTRQFVYQTPSGVQVTLTESVPAGFAVRETQAARAAKSRPNPVPAAPPPALVPQTATSAGQAAPANAKAVAINTITWTSTETGRTYTLSGSLSKQELEAIRQRLPREKR
ncbi:MAG: zf-HC2 domain-containing protein [Gemmatimonadales bacterium]